MINLKWKTGIIPAAIIAGISLNAQAADITITGTVPIVCQISVAGTGNEDIADLTQAQTDLNVATVTENCNDPDGYTVTIDPTNTTDHTGKFVDSVSGDENPFTIKYNDVALSGTTITDTAGTANDVDKSVKISYAANSSLTGSVSNTYAETLTFTITAK